MRTLKEIAKDSGTVKQYLKPFIERYEQLFEGIRTEPLTILEIGIGGYKDPLKGGGSLKMWAEYFKNSRIIGLDIVPKRLELPDNVVTHFGSQADSEFLQLLSNKYKGFDIVIDDASHVTDYTMKSFETLYPNTSMCYVIEDLHMASSKGTREYFQNIPGADFNTINLCVINKAL